MKTDTEKWRCPECGAGAQSLAYAEDITAHFTGITLDGNIAYVDNPTTDWSMPSNERLWCAACDTYFMTEDTEIAGTSLLEVHYR